jgi:hypothetical protein
MSDPPAKRKPGRPPLDDGDRTVSVSTKIRGADYDKLTRLAESHRISISAIARSAIRLALKRDHSLDE